MRQTPGVGSDTITQLLHQYGCLLVFAIVALQAAGAPLPGTTALIAAALYAATAHGLPIAGVIAAGATGALVGTTAGFALGRWGGETLLLSLGARLRQSSERVQRLRREFAAHGAGWLLAGRFISGVRNICG
ncbi:MAG: DedA family protein, partial [Solirubrobacteraceae bacterium]